MCISGLDRMNWYTKCFPATQSGAREGVVGVVSELAHEGLEREALGTVEIVLAEVINNIVEHAYSKKESGSVQVHYCLTQEALRVRVLDEGDALPNEKLPQGVLPSLDVAQEDLPEGGFGWSLIRALASDVRYNREAGQNRLALRFDL